MKRSPSEYRLALKVISLDLGFIVWNIHLNLFCAGSEDEGQDALHSDRSAIEDHGFEDPFTRRLYGRAPQREVATDGLGLNYKPSLRDGNLHLDCPCGVHLLGARRVDRFDLGNGAVLQHTF